MMPGNAKNRSATRISALSTQPPRNPAAAPITAPMIIERMTSSTDSGSVTRAPDSTRDSTSRPSSSVPNQCADDGAARMS